MKPHTRYDDRSERYFRVDQIRNILPRSHIASPLRGQKPFARLQGVRISRHYVQKRGNEGVIKKTIYQGNGKRGEITVQY